MCRIERYNLIFPDGHSEVREQLLNTCPRGTPSSPCHRREYVQVFRDRFATREENDEYLRRTAPLIEPTRGPSLRELQKSKKPKSVLQNLGIGFKMWHLFSSEKKEKERQKKYLIKERSRRSPNQITVVEPLPRAPSPPLAWTPRPQEPFYMPAELRRERGRPTNRHWEEQEPKVIRPRRKQARRQPTVIIHQGKKEPKKSRRKHEESDSDSDYGSDSDSDESSSERVRPYRRPHRSPSPDTVIIEPNQELERERNRRYRAERRTARAQENAQAEHDARIRAERNAAEERREQRRIADQDQLRLESAERAARRANLEAAQRIRDAQEQQELLDRETIRRRHMQAVGLTSRHPTRIRPVSLHHDDDQTMEAVGHAFIDRSIANADANMHRNAGPPPRGARGGRGGLMRRNSTGGTRGRGHGGYWWGHQRGRYGGSS